MDALRRKLHEQRGASMLMALLLMLAAVTVSAIVMAASSSAVSALRTDRAQEQAVLTVTSAAELVRSCFLSEDMVYTSTTVTYEYQYNTSRNSSSTTAQPVPDTAAFADFVNYAIGQLRDGSIVLPRVYTLHMADDRVSDVTATFTMTRDILSSGEPSYILSVELESADADAPCRMSLRMPSLVTTKTTTNGRWDWGGYLITTTAAETIQWTDGGLIQRKEADA